MPATDALILRFAEFELDPARFELRRDGAAVAVEPQVLSLLILLASNPDRLVGKDEIIEKVWDGRIVSEAAVASRVKSARQALGDDGTAQRFIRTVHGRGFRFVGEVQFRHVRPAEAASLPSPAQERGKPSIAVLPFRLSGDAAPHAFLPDALSDELIADLARLRWLFVIARGSSFRFRGPGVDCREVGAALGVAYCLTGSIAFTEASVIVAVELVDCASGGVIWAETYAEAIERIHELRREIAARTAAALEIQIPSHEAKLARDAAPAQLGAWSAYHVGLDHMFRFNRTDNALAAAMFARAVKADPSFARAHAGLSFTHFQNAFLRYQPDREGEAQAALAAAQQAMAHDRLDPFSHLNMGRSLWLAGDLQDSIEWLDRAATISPNYAQALYSKAWAETLSGSAVAGENDARLALQLSPLDPMRYAMLATCSLSHTLRGNYDEAVSLGERAARSPGAHKHIAIIAALAAHFAGQRDRTAHWIARARANDAGLTAQDFLASFPFAQSAERETVERALAEMGL